MQNIVVPGVVHPVAEHERYAATVTSVMSMQNDEIVRACLKTTFSISMVRTDRISPLRKRRVLVDLDCGALFLG
ncbi:MAG: hypothetical protein KBF56_11240, partial [Gemmatimonadaceae bacterium]|nr:hypothetical protein [Gemmatimonadaceae bacterium]